MNITNDQNQEVEGKEEDTVAVGDQHGAEEMIITAAATVAEAGIEQLEGVSGGGGKQTGRGTTLGEEEGIGEAITVAAAMSIIVDPVADMNQGTKDDRNIERPRPSWRNTKNRIIY
eukprot:jgi/Bigna1/145756/aug1.103_g20464